jgi:hypothetical protein
MADGTLVTVGTAGSAAGVPVASVAGIEAALGSTSGFTVAHAAGVSTFTAAGGPVPCNITYTAATGIVSGDAALVAANC